MESQVSDKRKQDFELFYFAMLRAGPSALGTLGKHSTTELHSPTLTFILSCSLGTKHKILALLLLLLIRDRSSIRFSEWLNWVPWLAYFRLNLLGLEVCHPYWLRRDQWATIHFTAPNVQATLQKPLTYAAGGTFSVSYMHMTQDEIRIWSLSLLASTLSLDVHMMWKQKELWARHTTRKQKPRISTCPVSWADHESKKEAVNWDTTEHTQVLPGTHAQCKCLI